MGDLSEIAGKNSGTAEQRNNVRESFMIDG
jgi:hypothetical protein